MRFNGFFHVGFFAHANSICDHPVYTGQPVLDSYRFTKKEISSLWASLLPFSCFHVAFLFFFAHDNSICDHPVYTGIHWISFRFTKKEISSLWASLLLFLVFIKFLLTGAASRVE
jgi:hypothetical protein